MFEEMKEELRDILDVPEGEGGESQERSQRCRKA